MYLLFCRYTDEERKEMEEKSEKFEFQAEVGHLTREERSEERAR